VSFAKGQEAKKAKHANVDESEAEEIPERVVKCWGCSEEGHSLKECPTVRTQAAREKVVSDRKEEMKRRKANKQGRNSEYLEK
jgi:hypothetical protein